MATNSFNPTPEEPTGVLPLETLSLRAVALTTHNITWSPDAELAVGSDDSIYLYLPEYPSQGTRTKVTSLADLETRRQYYEVSLHFPAVEMRVPELNRAVPGAYVELNSELAARLKIIVRCGCIRTARNLRMSPVSRTAEPKPRSPKVYRSTR